MGDPLLTPALVGAAVSISLGKVIDAAEGAIRVKESCKTLKAKVDEIVPLLKAAGQNATNWNQAELNWLKAFHTILNNAENITNECLQESRRSKWRRYMKVWQWRKLPSRIKGIHDQIDDARLNGILATLGVIQASNSTLKATKAEVEFVPQPLPPLIVGQGEEFKKLKSSILASHTKDKLSYIGVYGRSGAGKTVIARQLNNDEDILATYEKQGTLWMTVGLDARICDLYKTMGSFLNDGVFEKEYAHRNLEDQRSYLLHAIAKKKVFLILDDVWENQCDGNAMMYWLDITRALGSTILIITRSKIILSKVEAETEAILCLSKDDSWKLFAYHAFQGGPLPSNIPEPRARKVCEECQRLPLALKVIGRTMVDKTTLAEWECALSALQHSKQILDSSIDNELYGRLRLSYDQLKNDTTKTCFLYCATFPEDYKIPIKHLCQIWIGEGLFGNLHEKDANHVAMAHIQVLTKRSMVDRNNIYNNDDHNYGNHIVVHDILRDLAMYIIDTAKLGDCAYQCYFQVKNFWKTIPYSKAKENVQRISFMQSTISKWPKSLEAPNLRVCILSQMSSFERRLAIPTEFFSKMQTLQYLDLSGNYFDIELKLSSLKGLLTLHILHLANCVSLIELPESVEKLTSLTNINLSECTFLKVLPKSIGGLTSLTRLDLHGCESLIELPENIDELTSLTNINLSECTSLKVLPKSIEGLISLTKLKLSTCKSLIELPESISELTSLIKFDLSECTSLKVLPKSIGGLKFLTELNLQRCESLIELPESIGKLTSLINLNLTNCTSLKLLLKSIGGLISLTELTLWKCESLIELPESIGELISLTKFDLSECISLKVLPKNIGGLKSLTNLKLFWCESLIELPESIGELTSLTDLDLTHCDSLKVLPKSIGGLKSLTELKLGRCESLIELSESIGKLTSLTNLNFSICRFLKVLPKNIRRLKSLTELNLLGCKSLTELPESIGELSSLINLDLTSCTSLKVFPNSIGGLKSLTEIRLFGCKSLIELPESIGELTSLTNLDLTHCDSLKVLPKSIGGLKSLTELKLGTCESLIELPESIGKLTSLTNFDPLGCSSLKVLPNTQRTLEGWNLLHS